MNCIFIYNPNSGKSKKKKRIKYIINYLNNLFDFVQVAPTQYPKHATLLAKESCGRFDYLIVSGGDGTFSEIINGIAEQPHSPTIGYIPSGTVNDISRSLNIPRNYKKALENIKNNHIFEHDIFKVNENNYGIYFCGTGAFTNSSYATKQKSKRFWGKLAYFFYGIKQLFTIKDFRIRIIDSDGNVTSGKYIMMIIANSRSVAGFKINKNACLQDGSADVVLIKRKNSFWNYLSSLFTMAKLFLFGISNVKNKKHVTKLNLSEFSVSISKNLNINIDGEKGPEGNFNFKMLQKAVKIITPRSKKGDKNDIC